MWNMIVKEFLEMSRDPNRLRIILLVPLIQLIVLGYAANLDVKQIPTIVHDQNQTPQSRELVDRFTSSGYFTVEDYARRSQQVDRALRMGDAVYALVIPSDFAETLQGPGAAQVHGIVDGSDAAFSSRSLSYAGMIIRDFAGDVALRERQIVADERIAAGAQPQIRVWFNQPLDSRWFLLPGILALILMIVTMVGTAVGIVREKENGTLEQLAVAPIRPYQLMIGKTVPNAVVGMVEAILVLILVYTVFGIPIRGSIPLLLVECAFFLLSSLGLGLYISIITRTQQQAMMASVFFVMLPMILLSGFVFPIENMPEVIQWITYAIPVRYFFTILRGLFLRGVGLEVLWPQTLALLAFGVGMLILSSLRFRKRISP